MWDFLEEGVEVYFVFFVLTSRDLCCIQEDRLIVSQVDVQFEVISIDLGFII